MFSLVIPVYRNEASLPDLLTVLEEMNDQTRGQLEVIFVVDGSPDNSASVLRNRLPHVRFQTQLILLSRNFGAFAAIRAGITHARGDYLAVMAADLQEPPGLIVRIERELASGQWDVVVGRRESRNDPWLQKTFSTVFWWFYKRFVQPEVPRGGVDVFGCTREFARHLLALEEHNSTLVGLVFWLGFRRCELGYERRARRHGRTSWSFPRRFRYLLDSTFAFSDLPIRLLSAFGFIGLGLAITLGIVVFAAKVVGHVAVPGYAATVLIVLFFGGLNSLGLGILGEYVWRTFENTKGRPSFMVASIETFQDGRRADGRPD